MSKTAHNMGGQNFSHKFHFYLIHKFIEKWYVLSRGEICLANFRPPCDCCSFGNYILGYLHEINFHYKFKCKVYCSDKFNFNIIIHSCQWKISSMVERPNSENLGSNVSYAHGEFKNTTMQLF